MIDLALWCIGAYITVYLSILLLALVAAFWDVILMVGAGSLLFFLALASDGKFQANQVSLGIICVGVFGLCSFFYRRRSGDLEF